MAKLFDAITAACETTAQVILGYLEGRTFPPSAHTHTPAQAGALPANGTAADAAMLGGKLPKYYDRPSNLLDNSNFAVNQRGKTSYTGTGYGLDRWRTNFSGDTVEVLAGGVTNTVASTTGGWHLHQIIDNGAELVGKSITAACNAAAITGALYLQLSCRDSSDTEITNTYKKIAAGTNVATMTVPSGTVYIRVGVYAYATSVTIGDNVTLEWAALYEGTYTAETLPSYVPKSRAAELAECQRYYKQYSATSSTYTLCLSGYFTSSGKDIVVGIPANMRIRPTVTVNGAIAVRDANGYVVNLDGYASPVCSASGTWEDDWASIYFQKNDGSVWGGTNNTLCNVCLCANTVLQLNADL